MNNTWFSLLPACDKSAIRLYCLPYAGTSHAVFQHWQPLYEERLELALVKYPGRGARYLDPLPDSISVLVDELARTIAQEGDKPFALFGHSMGSLIAFELAHRLRESHALNPTAIYVSGGTAPSLRHLKAQLHHLSEADFATEILGMNGIPEEIANSPDLMAIFLPILRRDFALCERYRYRERPPLSCPITVFGGRSDPNTNERQLTGWKQETSGPFTLEWLEGDHFFLFQHERFIADVICKGAQLAAVSPRLTATTC